MWFGGGGERLDVGIKGMTGKGFVRRKEKKKRKEKKAMVNGVGW